MSKLSGILLAFGLSLAVPVSQPAFAKKKAAPAQDKQDKPTRKTARKPAKPANVALHDKLVTLKKAYRLGDISRGKMWEELSWLHDRGHRLTKPDRVGLLQQQAVMLTDAGYPILSAIYASQAVKLADEPLDKDLEPSWSILRKVSERKPIQAVLEIVADNVDLRGRPAPAFGTDWAYFAGNAAARRGEQAKALSFFGDVKVEDRYFFPAKYQQAMILVDQDKLADAEVALKAILYPTAQNMSPLRLNTRKQLLDFAYMALGRIYYEKERFPEAIKAYRMVSRDGINFYDSLFEQSWAFFMGGFPMHALGSLHAVESPFYADVFNPEAPMLRSIIHYWLCRYDDSRNALADFSEKYAESVEKLDEVLGRKNLDPEYAYTLFENLIGGVSSESLGIPKPILQTAAEKDSMLLVRDQYASIIEEKDRLEAKGIFGSRNTISKPLDYMDRWASALRKDIGKRFLAELTDIKKDYDRLYAQAQFLYVELLMSQKDQLLGRELHGETKITKVSKKMKVGGWGDKTQSWADSRNGEYWWDEVGYYIVPVDPQCTVPQKNGPPPVASGDDPASGL